MDTDYVFRSAKFGGFNKDDVLNYLELLKNNESKLNKQIEDKDSKIKELTEQLKASEDLAEQESKACAEKISEVEEKYEAELTALKNQQFECENFEGNQTDAEKQELLNQIREKDVYIQGLKQDLEDTEEQLAIVKANYNRQVEEYANRSAETVSSSDMSDEMIAQFNEKIREANEKNENMKAYYEEQIVSLNKRIEELKNKNERLENLSLNAVRENSTYASKSDEERIGAIIIDVRRYADMLIKETCEKIDNASESAGNAVESTIAKFSDMALDMKDYTAKVNKYFEEIMKVNDAICKDLTEFRDDLKIPFDDAAENFTISNE